jgi:cobalt-zinc-cadmium efflux system protein
MAGVDGVEQVHDVHAWSLSSEVSALSAHIVLAGHPTLEQAQAVGERVKSAVTAFGIAHATLELECEACVTGEDTPCSIESIGLTGGAPAPRLHSHHH